MGVYLGSNQIDTYIYYYGSITSVIETNILNRTITEYKNSIITTVGSYAFKNCSFLTEIDLLNVSSVNYAAFQSCASLISVNLPTVSVIWSYAFQYCTALTSINLPKIQGISNYAFHGCYNLISLNLLGISAVPTVSGSVFYSTPIGGYSTSAGRYGSVYVPASLYSSFLTAINWSLISSRIVSI